MKLLIISTAPFILKDEKCFAYSPYVKELVIWEKYVNEVSFCCPVWQNQNGLLVEEIPFETIPIAVEYVHHLVAMFGQADKSQNPNAKTIDAVARHMLWLNHWWSEFF